MLCYLDRAFCASSFGDCGNTQCYRYATTEHRKRAAELGLDFSVMKFRADDCGFVEKKDTTDD